MAALSDAQIYSDALAAGFTRAQAVIATAVALAESGGNPAAHNPVPPDDSWGLWQINMIGKMGPERLRQFGLSSKSQLADPVVNARAAYEISGHGKSFKPWTTFTHGTYRRFLARAQAAAGGTVPPPDTAGAGGTTAVPAGFDFGLGSAAAGILGGARKIVIEALFVGLGVALIGVGVVKLVPPKVRAAAAAAAVL